MKTVQKSKNKWRSLLAMQIALIVIFMLPEFFGDDLYGIGSVLVLIIFQIGEFIIVFKALSIYFNDKKEKRSKDANRLISSVKFWIALIILFSAITRLFDPTKRFEPGTDVFLMGILFTPLAPAGFFSLTQEILINAFPAITNWTPPAKTFINVLHNIIILIYWPIIGVLIAFIEKKKDDKKFVFVLAATLFLLLLAGFAGLGINS